MARFSCRLFPGPPRVGNIIVNELAERFCYYGTRSLLTLYLTRKLGYSDNEAVSLISWWIAACYVSPLIGGYLSDAHWGRYTTILRGSAVYQVGVIILAACAYDSVPESVARAGLFVGLAAVALATGGIKTSVAPFGADQITVDSERTSFFFVFYQAINVGSLLSYIALPIVRQRAGYGPAFTVPACFLALSILVFLAARGSYTRVPPSGSVLVTTVNVLRAALGRGGISTGAGHPRPPPHEASPIMAAASLGNSVAHAAGSSAQATDPEATPLILTPAAYTGSADAPPGSGVLTGTWVDRARGQVPDQDIVDVVAVGRLLPIYAMLPFFWAVYESYSAIWTLQASKMDLCFGSICLQPEQLQTVNPALIVTLIPLFDRFIIPGLMRSKWTILHPTPLRRMAAGLFLAGCAWVVTGVLEMAVTSQQTAEGGGPRLSVAWQLIQYVILTAAEICVSTTGVEFSYNEAPTRMKGAVLALWYVASSLGNVLNGTLYGALGGILTQVQLIWVSTGMLFAAALLFTVIAAHYKPARKGMRASTAPVHMAAAAGPQDKEEADDQQGSVQAAKVKEWPSQAQNVS